MKYSGSCLCGTVVFEVVGEFTGFYFCHCSRCRKVTGSAHNSNLFSTTAELKWICGKENTKTFNLPNTRFVKSFCINCGSALPNQNNGRLLVPAGSLNCDVDTPPTAHICMASKANWEKDLEHVRKFEGLPT